ncbi:hypothetical protein GCM10010080_12280 [Thermomonas carbonis]|nr:AraC family transcriptional regulator [Thermomonas carbonis]GHC00581.1 hypothetical protein GCM10010080_12280 [Thermomonas carbonis]
MHPVSLFVPRTRLPPLAACAVVAASQSPFDLVLATGDGLLDAGRHAAIVWCVLRGRVRVRSREGGFELGPREWIALDRDSRPTVWSGADSVVFAVGIDLAIQQALQAAADAPVLFPARGWMPAGARAIALRLWRVHTGLADGEGRMPDALRGFLAMLQRELLAGTERCPGHSLRRKRQVLVRMQRARLYLEGHAGGGLRVAELAQRCNFSPWYFTKIFHALYGIGPQQFAAQLRLAHACRLLSTTRLPVTEISAACGFDNPCSFSRAFRARHGMTASEYRLLHPHGFTAGDAADPWNAAMQHPWQQARSGR